MGGMGKLIRYNFLGFVLVLLLSSHSYSQLTEVMQDLGTIGEHWRSNLDYNSGRHHYPLGEYRAETTPCQYPHVFAESLIKTNGGAAEDDQYWYRYRGVKHESEILMIYKHFPTNWGILWLKL